MARDPDYLKTLEERKAHGDLRAYRLRLAVHPVPVNDAQLLLAVTTLFIGWMVSLIFVGGVLGLGALGNGHSDAPNARARDRSADGCRAPGAGRATRQRGLPSTCVMGPRSPCTVSRAATASASTAGTRS